MELTVNKISGIIFLIVLAVLPFFDVQYLMFYCYLLFVNLMLSSAWNLCGGYAGLILLGQSLFVGVGAYSFSFIYLAGFNIYLSMIIGGLVSACFAVILSFPLLKLKGLYFAIGTLLLSVIFQESFANWSAIGGATGFPLPRPPEYSISLVYYLALVFSTIGFIVIAIIINSRIGLALTSIGDDAEAAESYGIPVFKLKVLSLAVAAFFSGIAGTIITLKNTWIEPYSSFAMLRSIWSMNTAVIGGVGTLLGPVIGSIVITVVQELLAGYAELHLVFLGIILLVMIKIAPEGVLGIFSSTRKRLTSKSHVHDE